MPFSARGMAWGVAVLAAALACVAGLGDWRQRRRRDLDRVAWFDWRGVQVFALMTAIVAGGLAIGL